MLAIDISLQQEDVYSVWTTPRDGKSVHNLSPTSMADSPSLPTATHRRPPAIELEGQPTYVWAWS